MTDDDRLVFQTPPPQVTKLIVRMPACTTALPDVLSHLLRPAFSLNLRRLHIILEGSDARADAIRDWAFPAFGVTRLESIHLCLFKVKNKKGSYSMRDLPNLSRPDPRRRLLRDIQKNSRPRSLHSSCSPTRQRLLRYCLQRALQGHLKMSVAGTIRDQRFWIHA
jgi:hypothetical protein